jgi:hypothetical protein
MRSSEFDVERYCFASVSEIAVTTVAVTSYIKLSPPQLNPLPEFLLGELVRSCMERAAIAPADLS